MKNLILAFTLLTVMAGCHKNNKSTPSDSDKTEEPRLPICNISVFDSSGNSLLDSTTENYFKRSEIKVYKDSLSAPPYQGTRFGQMIGEEGSILSIFLVNPSLQTRFTFNLVILGQIPYTASCLMGCHLLQYSSIIIPNLQILKLKRFQVFLSISKQRIRIKEW